MLGKGAAWSKAESGHAGRESFGWWACRSGRSSKTSSTITEAAREVEVTGAVEEATCIIATWAAEVSACCNVAPWACRRGQKWKWAKVTPCSYTRRCLTNPLSMLLFPASKYLPPLCQEQSTIRILLINNLCPGSIIANAIYVYNTGTLDAIDVCSLVITPLYLRYQGATNCQVIASVGQWVLRAEMLSSVRPSHRNRHNSLANHHGNCQQNQKIHPQQKRQHEGSRKKTDNLPSGWL